MSDSAEKLRLADRAEAILRNDRSALRKGTRQHPVVLPAPSDTNKPRAKLA